MFSERRGGCCEFAGQAKGKKGGQRACAHCGQVAESAGEGAMTNGFRRMPIEPEVAAGDGEVGGDGQLLAWAEAEQGAVVADAEAESGS